MAEIKPVDFLKFGADKVYSIQDREAREGLLNSYNNAEYDSETGQLAFLHDNEVKKTISVGGKAVTDYLNEELHIVELVMYDEEWPFNNAETTVALLNNRNNIGYSIDVNVIEHSGGALGSITVIDRALNGFKVLHDGSAKKVTVAIKVSGGMSDIPEVYHPLSTT